MKQGVFVAALAAVLVSSAPVMARGAIETACLRSDRPAAGRALCGCLQRVADATLSAGEQTRGAAFFADPHKSQEAKASDRAADEAFWAKWEAFADTAVKNCQ